jgi:hypothetical protein
MAYCRVLSLHVLGDSGKTINNFSHFMLINFLQSHRPHCVKSYLLQKFITTIFDQCGHHQVLKLLGEETAVICCCLYC